MSAGDYFKIRAGVVLIKDHQILLARQNNKPFWVLPGGTQELGEGMEECAIREMKEETNLDVRIEKLLYLGDFIRGHSSSINRTRQSIDVIFLAHVSSTSGPLIMETTENLNELGWFSLKEMASLEVKPEIIAHQIQNDWENDFRASDRLYLGKYSL